MSMSLIDVMFLSPNLTVTEPPSTTMSTHERGQQPDSRKADGNTQSRGQRRIRKTESTASPELDRHEPGSHWQAPGNASDQRPPHGRTVNAEMSNCSR
jgi:hypothetical protein